MPLTSRQRHCLDQMGITVWRSRDAEPAADALNWLSGEPGDALQLLLVCSEAPQGQWLIDLLSGLRVKPEQAAWSASADACEQSPRWLLTLPENWPAPAAKRALWRQAQEQFRV